MSATIFVEAGLISAVVSFSVSYVTVRYIAPNLKILRHEPRHLVPINPPTQVKKPPSKKIKEKEKSRMMEYETTPEHSAVLRKIASDMRSQLKGYGDSISRVPVPVIVPEISTMALWSDLIRNHLHDPDFDFESNWYRYIELLRNHSRMGANLFVDAEALIKEKLVGYSAANSDNLNVPPPDNTVYYNTDLVSSIIRNWLDSIRGNELHYPLDNGTDIGMEDAKKQLKIPDARFLTLYNKKIGSGPEVIVEELEGIVKELMLNFHENSLFVKYRSNLTENEAEIKSIESRLNEMLEKLEGKPVFNGLCPYCR